MPTLREFARDHGLAVQTWKREYKRGKIGETVPDPKRPGRKIYAFYDAGKAQDNVNEGQRERSRVRYQRNQERKTQMRMFELLPRTLRKIFTEVSHSACISRVKIAV